MKQIVNKERDEVDNVHFEEIKRLRKEFEDEQKILTH